MGARLTVINDTEYNCTVKVYTVGKGFQVGDDHFIQREEQVGIGLERVWYDIDYIFEKTIGTYGKRVYMGGDRTVSLADIQARQKADISQADKPALKSFLQADEDFMEYLKLPGTSEVDPPEKSTALIKTGSKVALGDVENIAVFVRHNVDKMKGAKTYNVITSIS